MSLKNKQAVTAICHYVHKTWTRIWGQNKRETLMFEIFKKAWEAKTHGEYRPFPRAENTLENRQSILRFNLMAGNLRATPAIQPRGSRDVGKSNERWKPIKTSWAGNKEMASL